MRKYSWILALFVVLAMIFAACGDPPSGGGTVTCPGCGEPEADCSCGEVEIDVDLGDYQTNQISWNSITPSVPNVTFEDGVLTFEADELHQRVIFNITEDQRADIMAAFATSREVTVEIVATAVPDGYIRFGFCHLTNASGWNGSELHVVELTDSDDPIVRVLVPANGSATIADLLNGFVIQARGVDGGTDSFDPFVIQIFSINFIIEGGGEEDEPEWEEYEGRKELEIKDKKPDGSNEDQADLAIGKGWITDDDFEKIMGAVAPAYLEITVTAAGGGVATGWAGKLCRYATDDDNSFPINIATALSDGDSVIVKRDINTAFRNNFELIEGIFVNLWVANATVTKIELFAGDWENVVTIEDFDVDTEEVKKTYNIGEAFDPAGMVITVFYSNETDDEIELDDPKLTFIPAAGTALMTVGPNTIKVLYDGDEIDEFVVTVNKILESISIETAPSRTSYYQGFTESLSLTGIVVEATYVGGYTAELAPPAISSMGIAGFSTTAAAASLPVTLSYTEDAVLKADTFNITVHAIAGITIDPHSIFLLTTNTEDENEAQLNADFASIVVTASYTGSVFTRPLGDSEYDVFNDDDDVFDITVVEFDEDGEYTFTFKHLGKTAILTVYVSDSFEQDVEFEILIANVTDIASDIIDSGVAITRFSTALRSKPFTLDSGDYDSIKWFVDGVLKSTTASVTVNAADFATDGVKTLTVEIIVDGETYNQTVSFTVAQ
ncbi:MAG: bacterial Ig-like domain-containing protein [Treponema sp.]|nr:bacterial Ig-like domain-containing protein [Treponema sp.]